MSARHPATIALLAAGVALPARAAVPAAGGTGAVAVDVIAVLVPVLLVIAVLVALLFYARRRYRLTGSSAALSVVQILPVGPRERVVVVRTRNDRYLAVGVGAQTLSLIAELDPRDVALDPPSSSIDGAPGTRPDGIPGRNG